MLNIYKINFVLILFVACNTSSSLDDDPLPIYDSESNIIEDHELNSVISNEGPLTLLALGDSYTIGEGVNEDERWPNQFVKVAYENGIDFLTPKIIAMTGWKTYDLINGIESSNFEKKYGKKEEKSNSNELGGARLLDTYMNFSGQLQAAQQTAENKMLTKEEIDDQIKDLDIQSTEAFNKMIGETWGTDAHSEARQEWLDKTAKSQALKNAK